VSPALYFIHFHTDTRIIQSIPAAKPYKNKGWPLYESLAELLPSKASGQIAFHPLLQLSTLSMSSTPSISTAPQPPTFYDINIQHQENVLNTLEKGAVGSTNTIPPPPIPPPFDAA
jgi:hypothetical protein